MARRVAAVRNKIKNPYIYAHSANCRLSHPQAISDEFSDFYHKLYNRKDDPLLGIPSGAAIDSFLRSINLPSLSDTQLLQLNAPFSNEELDATIQSLPNGKSPGPDGFSNEYIKLYHPILTPHSFNHVLNGGTIPAENLLCLNREKLLITWRISDPYLC